MPAIDKKESLRKLADIAEGMGFRVWIDGAFLVASRSKYFREICDILGTFVQESGRQTRGTLYAVSNSVGPWGRIKELPDASGVEWLSSDSMRSLYTLKGAKRISRRVYGQ